MNPIKMILEHKPNFKFCQAKVEKVIRLADRDFENFIQNPMGDQDFVKENIGLMHMLQKENQKLRKALNKQDKNIIRNL